MGFKPTQVSKLLGTANDQEQVQKIMALQQPVVSIVIQYDPRSDGLAVGFVGAPITYEALRLILHRVIEGSIKDEAAKQAATAPSPPTSLPSDSVVPAS